MAIFLLLAAAGLILSYWPGIMTWDPIEQYDQARQGDYEDWHPPIMAWIWHFLIPILPGTAPMFLLQAALYLGGYGLLAGWAVKRGQGASALAFAACALMPIPMALMGSVLKDCLMTGAVLSAVALLVWRAETGRRLLAVPALVLLLLATALRFNAISATAPLIVALLPASWRRGRVRLFAVALVTFLSLLSVQPLVNRWLDATRTGVEYSQFIFDLAGITEHDGIDAFPALPVHDPVAITHRCYSPEMWDNFSNWDDPPRCRINLTNVRAAFETTGRSPGIFWLHAVATHPLAYAAHRWEHLKINLRVAAPKVNYQPAPDHSIDNPWHFDFQPNRVETWVGEAAVMTDHSPLGWPICWLVLAAGLLAISPGLPSRRVIVPITLSVILYGLSYAVISVASDLRYHLWTMVGTAVAIVIAGGDLADAPTLPLRRMGATAALFCLAAAWCLFTRMAGGA